MYDWTILQLSEITFNSLPNDKVLDWSKLKAFADDKLNVTKELKFVLGREENIVGKGENAGKELSVNNVTVESFFHI